MKIKKTLGLVAVAVSVTGLGTMGLASAASPTSALACEDSGQVLVLADDSGACPDGTTAVTLGLGQTGPRGAKGAKGDTGPAGPTGPQGPGAFGVNFHANSSVTGSATTIDGYKYYATCSVTGRGTAVSVTTQFVVVGRVVNGTSVSYTVAGPVMSQSGSVDPVNNTAITTVMDNFKQRSGATGFYATAHSAALYRYYFDLTVIGADASIQQFKIRLTADALSTIPVSESRCMIDGTVLPT